MSMNEIYLSISVFAATYILNAIYISIFYHRGLAHHAFHIRPWAERFIVASGPWVTGLDPKGWVCMHRMHHFYSDTEKDPHSPRYRGFFKLMLAQLHSYERVLRGLIKNEPEFTDVVKDLNFDVCWTNKRKLWILPYVAQMGVGVVLAMLTNSWLFGYAYWAGMMSHPFQGWAVNSFGHKFGYRNYNLDDDSRNNTLIAWLVLGEGFQNNHHKHPNSPLFAVKWWEVDLGYFFCHLCAAIGMIEMPKGLGAKADAATR